MNYSWSSWEIIPDQPSKQISNIYNGKLVMQDNYTRITVGYYYYILEINLNIVLLRWDVEVANKFKIIYKDGESKKKYTLPLTESDQPNLFKYSIKITNDNGLFNIVYTIDGQLKVLDRANKNILNRSKVLLSKDGIVDINQGNINYLNLQDEFLLFYNEIFSTGKVVNHLRIYKYMRAATILANNIIYKDGYINDGAPEVNIAINNLITRLGDKGYEIVFRSDIIDGLPIIHSTTKSARKFI
jgi:hypothetical protein